MIYKAVFCDIDGTLLDSTHALRPATIEAVRTLHRGGTPFVLVSARSPSGIFPIQKALGITGPIVCYGGALVVDASGAYVHSLGIDMERIARLKQDIATKWPSAVATVYAQDEWLADDITDQRVVREAEITGAVPTEVSPGRLAARAREGHKIFCVGTIEETDEMKEHFARENPDLAVVKSHTHYLEIMHGDATKANAMRALCQAMRLPTAEVVAFGDNYNDIDMLEQAGLGVAMGNAHDDIKQRADMVTLANDEDGVAHAIRTIRFAKMTHSLRFERAGF